MFVDFGAKRRRNFFDFYQVIKKIELPKLGERGVGGEGPSPRSLPPPLTERELGP